MDKTKFKGHILLITYAILLFMAIQNMNKIGDMFSHVTSLLVPFIYGFVIAYLFHRPFNFFSKKVFTLKNVKQKDKAKALNKILSLVCVYLIAFMSIIAIFSLIVPQLAHSIQTLAKDLPNHYQSLRLFSTRLLSEFELTADIWKELESILNQLITSSLNFIYNAIPNVLDSIINITSSITNFVFGFIISIYLLSNKDKLCRQARQLTIAFLPKGVSEKVISITQLTHKTFSNFITGQLLEAFILGILCFIGMALLKFPYALLISVIIGVSNMIPILGPILGTIPTTFIILMADPTHPMQAVWFVVFIIIIQQIDSNIIYPRVIGSSIGLSGLWVMFAILVFGGQFGLLGMIVGVPVCAVSYILLRESTYKRLRKKNIPIVSEED